MTSGPVLSKEALNIIAKEDRKCSVPPKFGKWILKFILSRENLPLLRCNLAFHEIGCRICLDFCNGAVKKMEIVRQH